MKKEIKYVIFLIIAVVLAGLVYFLVSTTKTPVIVATEQPLEQVEVTETIDNQMIVTESTTTPPVDVPVYTKEIDLVLMTSEEKKKIGINQSLKVQVLEKDENGTILAYRVITEDNPVLDKYGN